MRTVAVLGGGIGGLAASYYLCKNPQVTKVVLLESSSRFGGWVWSARRSDGTVFELGPRGIRPAGAVGRNTLNMVDDLGLGAEILPVSYSHVASKNRFLYVKGKLHRMPSGISGLLRTVPPFSRPLLFSIATEILVKKGKSDDESIHSFVSRRLGKELYNAEQWRGSLTLGMLLGSGPTPVVSPGPLAQRAMKESWAQWSLRRGVESLPESISEYLQQSRKAELHRDAAVKQINPSAAGWAVHLEDGVISADHIISALPAKALSRILPSSCQPLIQQLQDVSAVTVAVVNLEYEGSVLPVTGFGHLVPSSEDKGLLGVVYDSVPFPQHNRANGPTTRLTVMMGGAWFQEVFGPVESVTAESLLMRATEAVCSHLGVSAAPSWSRVTLHKDCIPQYQQGHHRRVESMRSFIQDNHLSLSLTGSSFDGVSVNDVIFSGRTAVDQLLGGGD
ncbi:protoporphyrinogen oxidase isoform X2 [Melanotaenia boesemani]|uniref:protoporphyrinogen oxidase isoform X2 n=1 Tax=Melanotaenia boesemani TaxID=1250792 RepID=UPI001C0554B1|nr:protoporphyrinogen oxidase isoform X2 [Melanotaenia boesemani]